MTISRNDLSVKCTDYEIGLNDKAELNIQENFEEINKFKQNISNLIKENQAKFEINFENHFDHLKKYMVILINYFRNKE